MPWEALLSDKLRPPAARPPHPATVVQPRASRAPVTTAYPPHAARVPPQRPPAHAATVLQRKPLHAPLAPRVAQPMEVNPLPDLRVKSTTCKNDCGVKIEVQTMPLAGKYFVSANSFTDARRMSDELAKVAAVFNVSPRKVGATDDYASALDKTTDVVIFKPDSSIDMHAEQHLLRILAEWLSRQEGSIAGTDYYVAGYNCPCKVCEPVVKAFRAALNANYQADLHYDPTPREGLSQAKGSGASLPLSEKVGTSTGIKRYNRFVKSYTNALKYFKTPQN